MSANALPKVPVGGLLVTRLILGSNPFAGVSHQSAARNTDMLNYHTMERIKETLRRAAAAGINSTVMRLDAFTLRVMREYRNEGGDLQWIAQVGRDAGGGNWSWKKRFQQALSAGASAGFLHGGILDDLYAERKAADLAAILEDVHSLGMPVGLAGHSPAAHLWADSLGLPVDFHMVCFYDCGSVHAGKGDRFLPEDPPAAIDAIRRIAKPCIGYKIMGAGRVAPRAAFEFALNGIKPGDCVNVGMHRGDNDRMIEENVNMVREVLAIRSPG